MGAAGVDKWLYPTDRGLYCEPGDFYVDPGARRRPRRHHARP